MINENDYMAYKKSFNKCLDKGKVGEEEIYNWLLKKEQLGNIKRVDDVRNDPVYQKKDIDFIITFFDNRKTYIDVKTDYLMYKTNNFVYEKEKRDYLGVNETSEAKFFLYYDIVNKKIYYVDVEKFKEYIHKNYISLPMKYIGDTSRGYLINKDEMIKNELILKIERIE